MLKNRMRVLVLDPILITVITPTKCYWMCPCIYDNPPTSVLVRPLYAVLPETVRAVGVPW